MNKDYNWFLKQNLSEFAGKWIAIHNYKVVESDRDIIELHKKLQKKNMAQAFITKVTNAYRVL